MLVNPTQRIRNMLTKCQNENHEEMNESVCLYIFICIETNIQRFIVRQLESEYKSVNIEFLKNAKYLLHHNIIKSSSLIRRLKKKSPMLFLSVNEMSSYMYKSA